MNSSIRNEDPVRRADAVIELWNKCLGDAFPLSRRLFLQQMRLDKDERILFTAWDEAGQNLLGAILAKRATRPGPDGAVPPCGFISFVTVAPEAQGRGLGGELLHKAEQWCRDKGATVIHLGSDYFHFFPGPPFDDSAPSRDSRRFFTLHGYQEGTIEEDLITDIALLAPVPADKTRQRGDSGFCFALCEPHLRPRVYEFFDRAFPGRWNNEIREAFSAGMRDRDLGLIVRQPDSSVVGFARIYDSESPILGPGLYWRALLGPCPGALGPIGVDASFRGLGLGLNLLHASLTELKRRGVRNTVIDWTDLGPFYAKLGFAPWKRYVTMKKELCDA